MTSAIVEALKQADDMMTRLKNERDGWKLRAETLERELRGVIKDIDNGCKLCAHYREDPCDGCNWKNHWEWRGVEPTVRTEGNKCAVFSVF